MLEQSQEEFLMIDSIAGKMPPFFNKDNVKIDKIIPICGPLMKQGASDRVLVDCIMNQVLEAGSKGTIDAESLHKLPIGPKGWFIFYWSLSP